uniref:Uncharacterized protein n=1 Tax=Ditylenchus dipsaci TaxID=166011 RepID=A0A915D3M6_9BILA
MKFDLESTEGDGADENLRGLDQQIAEQVVERKLEEVEERHKINRFCVFIIKFLDIGMQTSATQDQTEQKPCKVTSNTQQQHCPAPEKSPKKTEREGKRRKREKKRLKHLQKSTSDAQESYQSPEKTSVNSISSPPAPIVSLIPASPPLTSPIPSPIKRRRPCWESGSNTNASSPPKLPAMPRKLSPPVEVPVNGLKLRISKVLLSSKTRKKRHREVALPKEPVDLVHEAVFLPEKPADLPMEQVPLPEEPVNIASDPVVELENGKHHHRSNGSKKKKKREHRKREEIMEEVLPVTRREEEKPTQSLKIPKLKIKMMHKEGASTSSSSEVLPINNNHHHQRQSTSSSTQDSNLTLKIRPLKPPSSKSPKKVSPKNHAFLPDGGQPIVCSLLNGNHALFGLPAAQMKQNCGSIRAEAPHSPAFGGLSTGLNASRERVQFSPCDDDPEDDRLRSQTSQLLTKLM